MNIFDLLNNIYYELMYYLTFYMIQWLMGITLRLIRVYFLFKQKKLIMGRTIKKLINYTLMNKSNPQL